MGGPGSGRKPNGSKSTARLDKNEIVSKAEHKEFMRTNSLKLDQQFPKGSVGRKLFMQTYKEHK